MKLGGLDSVEYQEALAACIKGARTEGLDKVFDTHRVDAVIAPTGGVAWLTDFVAGDHFGASFSTPAAVAGYPHLTVPMGQVRGLPVGLSFIGTAWQDARLLALGLHFEQLTKARRPPTFRPRSAQGRSGARPRRRGGAPLSCPPLSFLLCFLTFSFSQPCLSLLFFSPLLFYAR